MLGTLLGPEIRELIDQRDFLAVREVFAEFDPVDVAECLSELPEEERVIVFRLLPHGLATEVFEYLEVEGQQELLRAMGREAAARILNDMSADDRTALLEELPGTAVAQLLTLLSPGERAVAQQLLNYPEGSVGRRMTPEFIAVRGNWTVRQTLDYIREHGNDSETLNVIYVTDERGHLIDDVRIREFLLAPLETRVSEIHDSSFNALRATDPVGEAVVTFKKYDRNTLPVVDSEDKLLGIVTVDDMLDVQEEVANATIQRMGGMEALEEPYISVSVFELVKKRGVWLVVLFCGQMFTQSAMAQFEGEIERAAVLATFVPLIVSSGGNSGSQATSLVIRALSVGEIQLSDWWLVMRRELAAGALLGLALGVLGILRVEVWGRLGWFLKSDGRGGFTAESLTVHQHYTMLGVTIGVAVVGVVLLGSLLGSMLPFLLKRLKLDPATSSAPFVATLSDVAGVLIYFTVATLILRATLL
jgi:magnesium transporter